MQEKFVGTLPSGMEFETRRFKGEHQDIITRNMNSEQKTTQNMLDVMADVVVRIGDDYEVSRGKLMRLGSMDLLRALLVTRFFSIDPKFPEKYAEWEQWLKDRAENPEDTPEAFQSSYEQHFFRFKYEYKVQNDDNTTSRDSKLFEIPLFLSDFEYEPYAGAPYQNIADFEARMEHSLVLPISGETVYWKFQQVQDEDSVTGLQGANRTIRSRKPQYETESKKGNPVRNELNIGKLDLPDIEAIREDILKKEAKVDTTIIVTDPGSGQDVRINVLNQAAFFFPSGAL